MTGLLGRQLERRLGMRDKIQTRTMVCFSNLYLAELADGVTHVPIPEVATRDNSDKTIEARGD